MRLMNVEKIGAKSMFERIKAGGVAMGLDGDVAKLVLNPPGYQDNSIALTLEQVDNVIVFLDHAADDTEGIIADIARTLQYSAPDPETGGRSVSFKMPSKAMELGPEDRQQLSQILGYRGPSVYQGEDGKYFETCVEIMESTCQQDDEGNISFLLSRAPRSRKLTLTPTDRKELRHWLQSKVEKWNQWEEQLRAKMAEVE